MRALGIETGADLRRHTLDFPQRNFGKAGSWYYKIARVRTTGLSKLTVNESHRSRKRHSRKTSSILSK
jgi:DNA polymerase-4